MPQPCIVIASFQPLPGKTHELIAECAANGMDTSDVVSATYRADNFISNEKARFNELNKRLKEAGLR